MLALAAVLSLMVLLRAPADDPAAPVMVQDTSGPDFSFHGDEVQAPVGGWRRWMRRAQKIFSQLAGADGDEVDGGAGSDTDMQLTSETGIEDHSRLLINARVREMVPINVALYNGDGEPMAGHEVHVSSSQKNPLTLSAARSDVDGETDVQVYAEHAGRDRIAISAAGQTRVVLLQVLPAADSGALAALGIREQDLTPWDVLMDGKDGAQPAAGTTPAFSPSLTRLAGQRIKVAGFMLPLETAARQGHFLLSASPPSCFFHAVPGSTTVIEVHSTQAVASTADPMVVDGVLELVTDDPTGILYRLNDAQAITQ
ncbi:MAG: hypothetical protein JWQ90_3386 [Hydrocarboniphaga sp.]|uniref:DUF3299 domain-containing protein n=1 Tax=Hydrocarboniphaga sp. TaxID=2033016 RepID=UPI002615F8FC|nr:DUF3299 domain-containing protein [Hydrocarboniphaga sp.]MDB5970936.1 hypothetical protein [Hydrocarboniphaga sp.]